MPLPVPDTILCIGTRTNKPLRYLSRLLTSIICRGKGQQSATTEVSHKEKNAMKKLLVILTLVLLMSVVAVPAALASGYHPPAGNITSVYVGGSNNFGMVQVQGQGNTTSLTFANGTHGNLALVGVLGCNNRTSVTFASGASHNSVGVSVASRCR
jgi:hypothetical protein